MHDAWYLNLEGTVHALHLQLNQEENALGNVGHISSTDLLHWERHTDVLPPLRGENTEDYHEKFTGCMVAHQDNFSGKQKIFCFYINRFHGPSGFISGNIVSIHALSSAACFFMKSIFLCCVIYWFYWVLLLFRHCQQRFVHTLFFFVLCRLLVLNGVAVSGRMCCHFGCVFF